MPKENLKKINQTIKTTYQISLQSKRGTLCVLHNLQKWQNIIINPADKGGAVVLWYWDRYTKESAKQTAETYYFKMPYFFHPEVVKLFL